MLPEAYLSPPPVRANMVQGANGSVVDANGSSRGISNPLDRQRLLELRKLADVLVTDGETARLEKYAVPLVCNLAVITRLGYSPEPRDSAYEQIDVTGLPPAEAIESLRDQGYKRILLEVGPTVLAELIHAGVVEELCLTNTQNSCATLISFGISDANKVFAERIEDTEFTIWRQIRG